MENKDSLKPFDKVLVRDYDKSRWYGDLFLRYYIEGGKTPYECLTGNFVQCIPYEGNEHLLGTTDKPEEAKYNKCFYNEVTERTYSTLKSAKLANVEARIYRCWLLDGEIKYMVALKVYNEQVCTIANADKRISDAIKNGTVGVGFKDKRMC